MQLGKNVVTRIRAPLVTDTVDNTLYRDWANAEETDIPNCMVEPFPLSEKLNFEDSRNREFAQSAVRVYAPPSADLVYTDRLRIAGEEYQILGHPGKWYDFKGKIDHVAVIAQHRAG